ncbi:Short-chain-enoyl-CoA hydratase [Pandoraea terrae]|uniref:3-hydroxyisobutyryl-CoA hydrolase n=1 Tax=Pandoraea terrae TaxID=1537710 RepID=A0A5E4RWT8_9BURK|nr:enoyl-CoA hydratase/isomerase family protein [Pandoraea terrae]VVD66894.1 Short-chain-enoyl-CoA hydratase [Pandoraea terrae]
MNLYDGAVAAQDEVLFEVVNCIGVVTLNRPRALNALSHGMIRAISAQMTAWATDDDVKAVLVEGAGDKAFCAGGDVRALYDSRLTGGTLHHEFFVDEYRLNYLTHRYPKPYLALLDGIVMGGGMGLSQGAALRLVTDKTRLAMPETGIGLFPDVGASWFMGRVAVTLSRYLGIAGVTIGAADALYAGLADLWLPGDAPTHVRERLWSLDWDAGNTADPLAQLRDALAPLGRTWAEDPPLARERVSVDRHFSAPDVAGIVASLAADADSAWARDTLMLLQSRSPLMMCVTDRQLALGRRLDLADCFRLELGLGYRAFEDGDFMEGVRALLVDKDKQPRWRPAALAQVTPARIEAFFTSPWASASHPLADLGKSADS